MATGIGSAIAFLAKRTDYRFLSIATGFSAGVMLYVSFVEYLSKEPRHPGRTLRGPQVGVAIAVAVALHNIPEGVSVSVPIYYATGNRVKAFWYSLLSGLAEPVGAVVAYLGLRIFVGTDGGGILFGGVAGIMVYISLDELLPTSRAYGKGHTVCLIAVYIYLKSQDVGKMLTFFVELTIARIVP